MKFPASLPKKIHFYFCGCSLDFTRRARVGPERAAFFLTIPSKMRQLNLPGCYDVCHIYAQMIIQKRGPVVVPSISSY